MNKTTERLMERSSFSGDGLVVTSYLDDNIVKGNVFSITLAQSFTASTPIYFTSNYATPGNVNAVFLLPILLTPSAGTALFKIYEDTEYAGGTALIPIDRNRTTANSSEITVLSGATGSTAGTLLFTYLFGTDSAGGPFGASGGGAGSSSNAIILDKTKKYLYEIETSDDCTVGIVAEFAEL